MVGTAISAIGWCLMFGMFSGWFHISVTSVSACYCVSQLAGSFFETGTVLPNLDALQANINTTHELGFIKAPLDVKKYSDLSLAKEAAQRLK